MALDVENPKGQLEKNKGYHKPDSITCCWIVVLDILEHKLPSVTDRLHESTRLAEAIELKVFGSHVFPIKKIRSSTLLGAGHIESLKEKLKEHPEVSLLFIDTYLTGLQQRNLEKELGVTIIDRPGLIIDIFAKRATSAEGRLQVELASLKYQKSRLVRQWTHLERQRGSLGFIGGPGESQLELDKRMISTRIQQVEKKLKEVHRTQSLHKKSRQRSLTPTIAFVGYTNAGKSTLFNRITNESVLAKDLLFATLDTTRRKIKLPSGKEAITSDTVGFISDLPPQLIAAFKSTLEETLDADLIVIVKDMGSPTMDAHDKEVMHILDDLLPPDAPILHVYNKVDQATECQQLHIKAKYPEAVFISALQNKGILEFMSRMEEVLFKDSQRYCFILDATKGAAIAWLHQEGIITDKHYVDDKIHIEVLLPTGLKEKFTHSFL